MHISTGTSYRRAQMRQYKENTKLPLQTYEFEYIWFLTKLIHLAEINLVGDVKFGSRNLYPYLYIFLNNRYRLTATFIGPYYIMLWTCYSENISPPVVLAQHFISSSAAKIS